ncbi:hypothetical protein M514_13326 [Trichuris suis]|uniref:Uncharacterized protein n=1 Tax=Trichuris suis TaxID=68888 RepID=A0A085MUR5_9BILA|nr:hypothetical protein M514_13326 [Trichuris suis]
MQSHHVLIVSACCRHHELLMLVPNYKMEVATVAAHYLSVPNSTTSYYSCFHFLIQGNKVFVIVDDGARRAPKALRIRLLAYPMEECICCAAAFPEPILVVRDVYDVSQSGVHDSFQNLQANVSDEQPSGFREGAADARS